MNVVIVQPSYIPWRGHFHLIRRADVFVFYDDVQYDKHGWRNRNQIKTAQGKQWLTIPVHCHGATTDGTPTHRIRIDTTRPWARNHWRALSLAYSRAPHFDRFVPLFEPFYRRGDEFLADFTIDLTVAIARAMGFSDTRFVRSSQLPGLAGQKTDRLIGLLKGLGATRYISGPSAREYIEPAKFAAAGIALEYVEHEYPEYPQLYPPFDPFVSIVDLLFAVGDEARTYLDPGKRQS